MNEQIKLFFDNINRAVFEKDELLFEKCWKTNCYNRQFSGPEGISGNHLYTLLTDNKLTLFFDLAETEISEMDKMFLLGAFLKTDNKTDEDFIYFLMENTEADIFIVASSRSRVEIEGLLDSKSKFSATSASFDEVIDVPIAQTEENMFVQFFDELNQALNSHSENKFEAKWFDKAYYHNLSGEGGLSGKELYTIATNASWQLNQITELTSFFENPDAILVHLSIWLKALEMEKPGEEALLLLIKTNNSLKILGYGTNLSAMRHLYLKYKEGTVL